MNPRVPARAVWFTAPRKVEVAPVELPEGGPGCVVRTLVSGISAGTELLAYRGELDPDLPLDESIGALGGTFRYPFRYGYSCVGQVERAGDGFAVGDVVFAFHPHQDRFVAEPGDVLALPSGCNPRLATLFPLVETALQISLDAGAVAHEDVVVIGLGTVGVLTALLLKRAGARPICSEPRAWRRDLAAELGIASVDPGDLADAVERRTAGGAPLAVEVSGNPSALGHALALLAHEGTLLLASWYGTKAVALPLGGAFHRRRLSLRSTQVSTIPTSLSARWTRARRRSAALALLAELPLDALATHTFAFTDAGDAYAAIDAGEEEGLLHAALVYE